MVPLMGPTDHSYLGMRALYRRFLSFCLSIWSAFGVSTLDVLRMPLTAGRVAWQGMELPIPWDNKSMLDGTQDEIRLLVKGY
jgi:hypothetical protein